MRHTSERISTVYAVGDITFEISGSFIPGRPAYTPPGEWAPIDPPEPPSVEDIEVSVVESEGLIDTSDFYVKRDDKYIPLDELFESALIEASNEDLV